jgi:hypothetical protein
MHKKHGFDQLAGTSLARKEIAECISENLDYPILLAGFRKGLLFGISIFQIK